MIKLENDLKSKKKRENSISFSIKEKWLKIWSLPKKLGRKGFQKEENCQM